MASLLEIRLQPAPDSPTEIELEHIVTDIPTPGAGGALYDLLAAAEVSMAQFAPGVEL